MKNWKTTLIGAVIAVATAVQPSISNGQIDWKAVGMGALIALFGFLAKDAEKTAQ
jgi:hypothetical protein